MLTPLTTINETSNGYLYVASKDDRYLTSAIVSCETLKEYYPQAHVTLVTEPDFFDPSLMDIFDDVILGPSNNKRLKLWGLANSPYERTLYIDADCVIRHPDIAIVHDLLGDADIMLTRIRPYAGAFVYFPGGKLEDHCGVILFNNKEHTKTFMQKWWELWLLQESGEWKWDTTQYPDKDLRPWDQWSYWWLMNKTDSAIRREYFPEPDARWNFVNTYKSNECKPEDIVIYHHTINLRRE